MLLSHLTPVLLLACDWSIRTTDLPTDWKTASPVGHWDDDYPSSASPHSSLVKLVSIMNISIFSHHLHIQSAQCEAHNYKLNQVYLPQKKLQFEPHV